MALEDIHLEALVRYVPKGEIYLYGYPDLLVNKERLKNAPALAKESAEIARWHGFDGEVFDTHAVLESLGYAPTYFDIHASRGREIEVDLNQPLGFEAAKGVLDLGTSEHCFNIGQVFKTTAVLVEMGGVVVHANPLSMVNHGFWNVSPGAYQDFYEANGFKTLAHLAYWGPLKERQLRDISDIVYKRFPPPQESMQLFIAKRVEYVPFSWPMQRKYRVNKDLKA